MDFNVMDTSVDNNVVTPVDESDTQSVEPTYTYDSNENTQVEPEVSADASITNGVDATNIENTVGEQDNDLDQEMAEIADYYDQLKNITIENLKLEKQLKEIENKIKENNNTKKEIKEKYADRF